MKKAKKAKQETTRPLVVPVAARRMAHAVDMLTHAIHDLRSVGWSANRNEASTHFQAAANRLEIAAHTLASIAGLL